MYFPARGALGYSHGLVLFAPFYVAVRPWLHPLQAYNATVFLVLTIGTICFYVIVRKFLKLGFVESLLMTAFFATSPNVINEPAGIWTQRVSVFLLPPLVLAALAARGAGLAADASTSQRPLQVCSGVPCGVRAGAVLPSGFLFRGVCRAGLGAVSGRGASPLWI